MSPAPTLHCLLEHASADMLTLSRHLLNAVEDDLAIAREVSAIRDVLAVARRRDLTPELDDES